MISIQRHFLETPVYRDAWVDRPADLQAYICYRHMVIEHTMRRQFPRLFTIEGRMQPVVDELVRANILRSAQPWEYAPATLPKSEAHWERMVMTDRRWANVKATSAHDVVHMLRVITGDYVRSGYRAHPKTFAQMREWDYTNSDEDAHYVGMMWLEEDWVSDLMVDIEILYYNYVRGTAAEETL